MLVGLMASHFEPHQDERRQSRFVQQQLDETQLEKPVTFLRETFQAIIRQHVSVSLTH